MPEKSRTAPPRLKEWQFSKLTVPGRQIQESLGGLIMKMEINRISLIRVLDYANLPHRTPEGTLDGPVASIQRIWGHFKG